MDKLTGFVPVREGHLAFQSSGQGFPLVLMHGFSLDQRMWEPQIQALSQTVNVITYDLRGFGKSSLPTEKEYSHSEDLKLVMQYLGCSQISLLGLSRGGRYALNFALEYPDMVDRLILADSMPDGFVMDTKRYSMHPQLVKIATTSGIDAAKQTWLSGALFEQVRKHSSLFEHISMMVKEYSGWHWLNRDSVALSNPPASTRLEMVKSKTLVLIGEYDVPEFQVASLELARRIPNAVRVVIPKVGHMSNIEDPHSFNQVVSTFLQ